VAMKKKSVEAINQYSHIKTYNMYAIYALKYFPGETEFHKIS
jgi:hypothetical protein